MNLHDALRQTTRHSNEALERLPGVAVLVSRSISMDDYKDYLVRHAGHSLALYETLMLSADPDRPEHHLLFPTFRPDALCADLKYFGIEPTELEYDNFSWLDHADADYQLGVIYVHLSSALGARLIVKHLQRYLELTPETGSAYFHAMADSALAWKSLINQLQGMPTQGQQARSVLSGARQACYLRHRWLDVPESLEVAIAS